MNKQLIITKDLIRKAYNINSSIPKGYGTKSSDYEFFYDQKEKILFKVVEKIVKYQLPIKYGVKDSIIYFSFDGEQFSFHSWCKGYIYGCTKEYNGNWMGTARRKLSKSKNGKIPGNNNRYAARIKEKREKIMFIREEE